MSKYEEMRSAARAARAAFDEYRQRSVQALGTVVEGLEDYCEVPNERIVLLKWNGEYEELRGYVPAEAGRRFALPGAVEHDSADGYWYLGLQIWLNQTQWITFPIGVIEIDGQTKFKMASSDPKAFNPSDPNQVEAVCIGIANEIIRVYREPRGEARAKKIGFEFSPQPS